MYRSFGREKKMECKCFGREQQTENVQMFWQRKEREHRFFLVEISEKKMGFGGEKKTECKIHKCILKIKKYGKQQFWDRKKKQKEEV